MKDSHKSRYLDLYIPFLFFFNKSYGLSLPLIALQKMNVKIDIKFKKYNELINYQSSLTTDDWEIEPNIKKANLIIDYIFLDTKEREIFAKSTHDILIEQVKKTDTFLINSSGEQILNVDMNNLTKSMYWVFKLNKYNDNNLNYTFLDINDINSSKRFCLIILYHLFENIEIKPGSVFNYIKLNENEYTFEIVNLDEINNTTNPVSNITFNYNYKYYENILDIFSNLTINKLIDTSDTNIDYTYITLENDILLDIEILSSNTNDIFKTSENTIDENSLFYNFTRNELNNLVSPNEDLIMYNPNNYGLYINNEGTIMDNFKFKMESLDRVPNLDANYFNIVQSMYYAKNLPKNGIYQYSYSLYPDKYQPSGSANMRNINNIDFVIDINNKINNSNSGELNIYVISYNILRIVNGVGGLAYS